MKVLLRKNIRDLGIIGDMVEVKSGYARNYLLPQGLAAHPTAANLKAIEADKQQYLAELARQRADLEAKAAAASGKQAAILARANEEGHLYGSVGPAQIAAAFAEKGLFLEVETVILDGPIRQVGEYDVTLEFAHDIKASVHVSIQPLVEAGEPAASEQPAEGDAPAEDQPPADDQA
jgi:large subunit ribosomal protein L9